jgi:glycosyltransferase involved in cell wall biosynthesis
VVEALAWVQQAHPDLDVVWLGHAAENDRAALQQDMDRFGLRARSTGTLPLEELAHEIAQANLLLLPQPLDHGSEGGISLKNGTLSAAMAAALPIIATRGDMTDTGLLQHGNNIHLLPDNKVESWQHAIEYVLQHADYRNGLSQSGYAFYQSHLSWEVVGEAFEGLIGLPSFRTK